MTLTGLPYDVLKDFSFKLPAKIFFCAEDESETVVVEEFINGENLLNRIERENFLSEPEAREILLQMCDGLKELHEQKIIHRDIKPSNMILQGDRIRLIDFDAARIFKDDKETDTRLLGTKGYAPPEQFGSGQTDPRSDIYSLGVTMKNLLGGNCGELKKILDKCTELDPKNRFQNVDELKSALTFETPRRIGKIIAAMSFVTAIGIFLFVSSSTLNRAEILPDEKISEPEKISQPAQKNSVAFPKIFLPQIETPTTLPELPEPKKIEPPAKSEQFTLPQIVTPPLEPPSPIQQPPPIISPPAEKISSGKIQAQLYINESLFNSFEHTGNERTKLSRAQWKQMIARLHVSNDTDRVWVSPKVRYIIGQNWGIKFTETKNFSSLAPGESTDFEIPFDLLEVSDNPKTSTYIQIWLDTGDLEANENYWCEWYDITD